MVRVRTACLFSLIVILASFVRADDGAASIAAGGIVVMKKEPRIVMAKEVLQISLRKVIVDYDFRNDSDEDITTMVAFPVPVYPEDEERVDGPVFFDDFKLWINGAPTEYKIEARAFLGEKEYTQLLTGMKVNIATLGVTSSNVEEQWDVLRLTTAQRQQLVDIGLIDKESSSALWKVHKKYYWQQTFPAHKMVHIRHEYSPATGGTAIGLFAGVLNPDGDEVFKSFCVDDPLKASLQKIAKTETERLERLNGKEEISERYPDRGYAYVDFILTTANTWKAPIEDFTLIVERRKSTGSYVSFCWDGPVTKIDENHFSAHLKDFVPKTELRVGYFTVEKVKGE